MPRSVRPWVTATIAVVGTSAVVLAPMELPDTALPADVQITNTAVQLNASPTPFDYYPQVLKRSLGNAGDRLAEYLADPLPIVRAIAENQYHAFADVAAAAADLDPVAFARAVVVAIAQPIVNVVKVFGTGEPFELAAGMPVRVALPFVSGLIAAGSSVTDTVHTLLRLDLTGAADNVVNLPGRVVDGVLNGRVDGVNGNFFGLLSPVEEAPVSDRLTGPVSFLIHSLQEMGDAIAPPAGATAMAGPAAAPDFSTPTLPIAPSIKHIAVQGMTSAPSTAAPDPANSARPENPTAVVSTTPENEPAGTTTVSTRPDTAGTSDIGADPAPAPPAKHRAPRDVTHDSEETGPSTGAAPLHRTAAATNADGSSGAGSRNDSHTGSDSSAG